MAKRSLGGLVSLLGGLDMSPITNARNFTLAQQQQEISKRTAAAEQALAQQRLDLDKTRAQDALFLGQEDIGLRREEIGMRREEGAAQRDLSRELLDRQQQGTIDLQNLVGAQEVAELRLKGELDTALQTDLAELATQRQERLIQAQGENLDKELQQQKAIADREYELAKQRGDDEAAKNILEREYLKVRNAIAKAQETAIPGDETHKQKIQKLEERAAELGLEKLARELEETDPNSEVAKTLREVKIRGAKAGARIAEAQATQEEQVVEGQEIELGQKRAKQATEAEKAEVPEATALTSTEEKEVAAAQEEIKRQPFTLGTSGNQFVVAAAEELQSIAGVEGEEQNEIRSKLRRVMALGRKLGKGTTMRIPFRSERFWQLGQDLPGTEAERDEFRDLIEELFAEHNIQLW